MTEWFSEIRLSADGGVDVVPREAVKEIVFAAVAGQSVGTVGSTGVPTPIRTLVTFHVVGIEDWRAYWSRVQTA